MKVIRAMHKDSPATSLLAGDDAGDDLLAGDERQRGRLLAAGGLAGAILSASCCIVPLLLVSMGVSGAWIGSLTVLEPYRPLFALGALGLLAAGFWHINLRQRQACAQGSYCARPQSRWFANLALAGGTLLSLAALTIDWWAPLFV